MASGRNLKDSSYWGNSSGTSYTSTYNDARFEGGKYLGTSESDYFTLPLDKVTLPDSWTLEWVQYVPYKFIEPTERQDSRTFLRDEIERQPSYIAPRPPYYGGSGLCGWKKGIMTYTALVHIIFVLVPVVCLMLLFIVLLVLDSLEHYAIVKSGGNYSFYVNGVETSCLNPDTYIGDGIQILDSGIRFYVGSRTGKTSGYVKQYLTGSDDEFVVTPISGTPPTSSNFTDANYNVSVRGISLRTI